MREPDPRRDYGVLAEQTQAMPIVDGGTDGSGRRRADVRRSHSIGKIIGMTMLVMSLIVGLGMVYIYRDLNGNLTTVDLSKDLVGDRPDDEYVGAGKPLNILVMGSDSRDCDGCALDRHTGEGQRSDTTILLHLSADRERAYGISIPRDTIVDRPDCKLDDGEISPAAADAQWNEAFGIGGPTCTVEQVHAVTDIAIDHFIEVDFNSFQTMVDAIGGVEICLPETLDDPKADVYLEAGTHKVDGKEALGYVRTRHGLGDGSDLSRTKRQQAFIGAMANGILSAGTLANPVKVVRLADAATEGLTVDDGLDVKGLADFGMSLRGIGLDNIQFLTAPVAPWPEDNNRVMFDESADKLWDRIRKDKPLGGALSDDSLRADSLPGATEKTSDDGSDSGDGVDAKKKKKPSLGADEREFVGLCTGA